MAAVQLEGLARHYGEREALGGVSLSLEGGQCDHLRVRTLILLSAALGFSPDYLLGVDKHAKTNP